MAIELGNSMILDEEKPFGLMWNEQLHLSVGGSLGIIGWVHCLKRKLQFSGGVGQGVEGLLSFFRFFKLNTVTCIRL